MENLTLVSESTKDGLFVALSNIANEDADFNGDNGDEYLWKEAEGFYSNLEYTLHVLEEMQKDGEKDERTLVEKFFEMWIENDSYYDDYAYNYISDNGKVLFISLAFNS